MAFPSLLFPGHLGAAGPPPSRCAPRVAGWGRYEQVRLARQEEEEEAAGRGRPPAGWAAASCRARPRGSRGGGGGGAAAAAPPPPPGASPQPPAPPRFEPRRRPDGEGWVPAEPAPVPLTPPSRTPGQPGGAPAAAAPRAVPAAAAAQDSLYVGQLQRSAPAGSTGARAALDFAEQLSTFFLDHSEVAFGALGRLLQENLWLGDAPLWGKAQDNVCRMAAVLKGLEAQEGCRNCPAFRARETLRSVVHVWRDWLFELPLEPMAGWVHEDMAEQWRRLSFDDTPAGGALVWLPGPCGTSGCLAYPAGEAMNQLCFREVALVPTRDGALRPRLRSCPAQFELNGTVRQVAAARADGDDFVGVRSDYLCGAWRIQRGAAPWPLQVVRTDAPCCSLTVSPHLPGELSLCTLQGALYLWNVETGLQRLHQDPETLYFREASPWRWSEFTAHPRVLSYADRTGLMGIDQRFSVYVLDERFPLVPALRWEHMMQRPPIYAHLTPAGAPQRSHKLLLGAHHSQELLLLQYAGGSSAPCQLWGPPQKLSPFRECLPGFPRQVPLRHSALHQRLSVPAAGIAAALGQQGTAESLLIFQLSEAGDLFYQPLLHRPGGLAAGEPLPEPGPSQEGGRGPEAGRPSQGPRPALTRPAAAAASSRRWLRAWKQLPTEASGLQPPCLLSQSRLFTSRELQAAGAAPHYRPARQQLRRAMQQKQLLCPWPGPAAPLPPASEPCGQPAAGLGQRLSASWTGSWDSWWQERLGTGQARKQQALRREQRRRRRLRRARGAPLSLSGSFTSSTSYQSDLSDVSGWPGSDSSGQRPPSRAPPGTDSAPWPTEEAALPAPQAASSQEPEPGSPDLAQLLSSQTLGSRGIPKERRRTLRDYLAIFNEPPEPQADLPASQASSLGSQRPLPSSQGSQRKRARMGF
ncbi:TATA box-binding protein-associated factor, RNA polymerase I, subunit C-like isoform X2 [Hemicordylus capensis]|uniref:TATA box-binding protein-associated factor, RNA polymerase I, subunit C-like isoform X2 n=1 Tax=Hemicordylus capensis TaxID=884348 RepID=UPI0023031B52|nr:TATA box-binding protein-associated factor, RNA polymerase I, subunit C-like isoform X2 [Hemicordylus capensis]